MDSGPALRPATAGHGLSARVRLPRQRSVTHRDEALERGHYHGSQFVRGERVFAIAAGGRYLLLKRRRGLAKIALDRFLEHPSEAHRTSNLVEGGFDPLAHEKAEPPRQGPIKARTSFSSTKRCMGSLAEAMKSKRS